METLDSIISAEKNPYRLINMRVPVEHLEEFPFIIDSRILEHPEENDAYIGECYSNYVLTNAAKFIKKYGDAHIGVCCDDNGKIEVVASGKSMLDVLKQIRDKYGKRTCLITRVKEHIRDVQTIIDVDTPQECSDEGEISEMEIMRRFYETSEYILANKENLAVTYGGKTLAVKGDKIIASGKDSDEVHGLVKMILKGDEIMGCVYGDIKALIGFAERIKKNRK